jgi:hypothetical protein
VAIGNQNNRPQKSASLVSGEWVDLAVVWLVPGVKGGPVRRGGRRRVLEQLVQFAAIAPDASALRAVVDFDPLAIGHQQGCVRTSRAFHGRLGYGWRLTCAQPDIIAPLALDPFASPASPS